MLFTNFAALLFAVSTGAATPHDLAHELRTTQTTINNATIYAYSRNISGLPVLVDSSGEKTFTPISPLRIVVSQDNGLTRPGIAHISAAPNTSLSQVTWTITTNGAVPWTATQNSTNGSVGIGEFYIITTADAFSPVGFAPHGTAPSGAETLGFTLYGSDITFISGSTYQEQFWATPTSTGDAWEIVWNESGADHIGSAPVILKTTPPTS